MNFNEDLYEKIAIHFFGEMDLLNQVDYPEKTKNEILQKEKILTGRRALKYVEEKLNELTLPISPLSNKTIEEINQVLLKSGLLLQQYIAEEQGNINEHSRELFLKYIGFCTYYEIYHLENINKINTYIQFCNKILEIVNQGNYSLDDEDKQIINFIKRCLYTSLHELNFDSKKQIYDECTLLMKEDIEFSENSSEYNYILALTNYLNISLDHFFLNINRNNEYIDTGLFFAYMSEMQQIVLEYVENNKEKEETPEIYKIFEFFFRYEIYKLNLMQKEGKTFGKELKKKVIVRCTELVKIFYKDMEDYNSFFDDNNSIYSIEYTEAIKAFSFQIAKLLNDNANATLDILYIIFKFLSTFPEFTKLNLNIYKRLTFILQNYRSRKIYTTSTILYLKSFTDLNFLKKELSIVKNEVEKRPTIALINLYNEELSSMYFLPQELIGTLIINPIVISIHEKIFLANKIIFTHILKFRSTSYNDKDYNTKLEYLSIFQNEMNNIIKIVADPYFIQDLGKIYSFFIDSYIKSEGLDYRKDFIQKATQIKMTILDINPLNFAISLLFSKMGKIMLILNHKDPKKLAISKKKLTTAEREEISLFFPLSLEMLPKYQDGINWNDIDTAINKIREPAVAKDEIAPTGSRILKALCAILNKITRQEMKPSTIFPTLYEEAYSHSTKSWVLDPIMLFYFNAYFSKAGLMSFLVENSGEKINLKFSHLNNSLIYEKINSFIKDLVENTVDLENDILLGLEELRSINQESIIDEKGSKKNITKKDIDNFIKNEKTLHFERAYIDKKEMVYLSNILKLYLENIGKSSISNMFIFIFDELLENANKANLKRAHYNFKNLDMDEKYFIGLTSFLEGMHENEEKYIDYIKKEGLMVKVLFQIENRSLKISVSNNYKIHNEEALMINECVKKARRSGNLKSVYKTPIQTREGEGLGIIITLLLLRKLKLDRSSYIVDIKDSETIVEITLPFSAVTEEIGLHITEEITKEIDKVPMLPENIQELKERLKDPKSTLDELERIALRDPALSADILRIANSSYYMLANPILSVKEGIKIIGTKNIDDILLASSCYRQLDDKTTKEKLEDIIHHSEMTAYFAKQIVKLKKIDVEMEDIYISSLLHDIGKIVVDALNPDIYVKIQSTKLDKNIPIDIIEDLAGGINHALIGSMLAQKWKFPEIIQEVIKYHHTPHDAQSYTDAVFTVYLANTLTSYNADKIAYENIDYTILKYFNLENEEILKEFSQKIQEEYNRFELSKKKRDKS